MTLTEIANELVAGCREGRSTENLNTLYAEDAVSMEAMGMGEQGPETKGLEGIRGKHAWWDATFEVLDGAISDPLPHGDDRFAVIFEMKAKEKATGKISDMKEVAVYHVANGKIVREEFFYGM